VEGQSILEGYAFRSDSRDYEDRVQEFHEDIGSRFWVSGGTVLPDPAGDTELSYFMQQLKRRGNITLISAPMAKANYPIEKFLYPCDASVMSACQRMDYRYFQWATAEYYGRQLRHLSHSTFFNQVWPDLLPSYDMPTGQQDIVMLPRRSTVPSLQVLCMRRVSRYRMAFGRTYTNARGEVTIYSGEVVPGDVGRLNVVAAEAQLYKGHKYPNAVLKMNRPTHELPAAAEEVLPHVITATRLFYRKAGITEFQKEKSRFTLKNLMQMFLGASSGLNKGVEKNVKVMSSIHAGEETVRVSPCGQKYDIFDDDLRALYDFIVNGKEPPVFFNVTGKNENFSSQTKARNDMEYGEWCEKIRNFVIPSSIFILMERVISMIRHLKERGRVIRVGHRWGHGGMDTIAGLLKATLKNCFKKCWHEGDIGNFDQSVKAFWVELYWSYMGVHEDPTSEDYEIKERIAKFLLKVLLARITHLFGEIWGIQVGGVPSGIFNTSHMDSWIMAMYFFLFCVFQVATAPVELQDELESIMLDIIELIVYGDDHVYYTGDDPLATSYFGTDAFARFLEKYFDVKLKDLRSGVTFASVQKQGWLALRGSTFLKHHAIINELHGIRDKQPQFLPFRETFDYIVKASWGRETRTRDSFDVALSLIGHAYGTYASNLDAYMSMKFYYEELMNGLGVTYTSVMDVIRSRVTLLDLKKMRQMGMSDDDLLCGFPSWETLVMKNQVDLGYQTISTSLDVDYDEEIVWSEPGSFDN
jgi:hypothetical protein